MPQTATIEDVMRVDCETWIYHMGITLRGNPFKIEGHEYEIDILNGLPRNVIPMWYIHVSQSTLITSSIVAVWAIWNPSVQPLFYAEGRGQVLETKSTPSGRSAFPPELQ